MRRGSELRHLQLQPLIVGLHLGGLPVQAVELELALRGENVQEHESERDYHDGDHRSDDDQPSLLLR